MTEQPTVARAPLVPTEVLEFWRAKDLRPAFSWQDVWGEEHAFAHTVAGVLETDVLRTFHAEIGGALERGEGFETFRARMRERLTPRGWWGPRTVTDPVSGRDKVVDFSAPRRLQTTFWSNVRSARAAGQWERAQRTKAALPYLLYVRTTAAEPRPEHLRWAGTILPVDDPFWRTHFPPNGWGCKCPVRQITRREAEDKLGREGYADRPPDEPPPRTYVNRRTGEVSRVPAGIDPGWHTNPGLARARTLVTQVREHLAATSPELAEPLIERLWQSSFLRVLPRLPSSDTVWAPAGVSRSLQSALQADTPLAVISHSTIEEKIRTHRGSRAVTIEAMSQLPRIIADGRVLDEGRPRHRTLIWRGDDGWWVAVVKVTQDRRELIVQSFHPRNADKIARLQRRARES